MINQCQNCGAPLDVTGAGAAIRCIYCGVENRVPAMRTLHLQRPADWRPPATWTPPKPRLARARTLTWLIVLAVALVSIASTLDWRSVSSWLALSGVEQDGPPSLGAFDPASAPTVYWEGTLEGAIDASTLAPPCRGIIAQAPQALIHTSVPASVLVTTVSEADLTLAARRSDGSIACDDDSGGGMTPRLRLDLPPGDHRVWVGAFRPGEHPRFGLRITTLVVGSVPGADGLAADAPPTLGTALVNAAGVSAERYRGSATGIVSAGVASPACRGYLPVAPQLTLQAAAPHRVRLTTEGQSDLVLYVRSPDGRSICDDDSGELLNPLLDVDVPVGVTKVWVGTLHQGDDAPFELVVESARQ